MGGWISIQEHQTLKVWSAVLEEWKVDYNPQALQALLMWAKDHGFDTAKEAAFDLNSWL